MLADRGAATPAAVSSFRSPHLSPGKFLLCYLGGGGQRGGVEPAPTSLQTAEEQQQLLSLFHLLELGPQSSNSLEK